MIALIMALIFGFGYLGQKYKIKGWAAFGQGYIYWLCILFIILGAGAIVFGLLAVAYGSDAILLALIPLGIFVIWLFSKFTSEIHALLRQKYGLREPESEYVSPGPEKVQSNSREINRTIQTWQCPFCNRENSEDTCPGCGYGPSAKSNDAILTNSKGTTNLQTESLTFSQIVNEDDKPWRCPTCGIVNQGWWESCANCGKLRKMNTKTNGVTISAIAILALVVVLIIIGVAITNTTQTLALKLSVPAPKSTIAAPTRTPFKPSNKTISPTQTTQFGVYPNPPEAGCVHWSQVRVEDEGDTLCVYGLVHDSYTGDKSRFYIRFSETKDTFRMIMLDGWYVKLESGDCVTQTGEIKVYDKMPYMEFADKIWMCKK